MLWNAHVLPSIQANANLANDPPAAATAAAAAGPSSQPAGSSWGRSQATAVNRSSQSQATTSAPRMPNPIYVEVISVLERLLNYNYTGAAKVLPRRIMMELWPLRGIMDTGFPVLWPGFIPGGASYGRPPLIDMRMWPVDDVTHRPLVSSRRTQEITYGRPHFVVRLLSRSLLFFAKPAVRLAHTRFPPHRRTRRSST